MAGLVVFDRRLSTGDAGADEGPGPVYGRVCLPFELRQRARMRVQLESGEDVGIQLPRGTVLRGGDRLAGRAGGVLIVLSADEAVSTVSSTNPRTLARAAYHLGNRHVSLEVGTGWLRYLEDHVLDAMVVALGLGLVHEKRPFEPEAGAYAGDAHSHAHEHRHGGAHVHSHDHDHDHDHDHSHEHAHGAGHSHEHESSRTDSPPRLRLVVSDGH